MANTTHREKSIKELFIGECWSYLRNNFHKFNQTNQIKIALALATKDIPQEHIGEIRYTSMSVIKIQEQPLILDLGEDLPESVRARMN